MRLSLPSPKDAPARQRMKLLLWATLASLLFGAIDMGMILEDGLRVARNSLHKHPASGEIVFVGIDDESRKTVGEWPWPRSVQAKMVERAQALGAKRIFLDFSYSGATAPEQDAALVRALKKAGRDLEIYLAVPNAEATRDGGRTNPRPKSEFAEVAKLASIKVDYNYQNAAWELPFNDKPADELYPSFSAALAGNDRPQEGTFRIDYSIDARTVPYVSAGSLVSEKLGQSIAGKTLVVGLNSALLGDQFWIPGEGRMAGAMVHILGAETLMQGSQLDLGWLALLMCAVAFVWFALNLRPGQAFTMLALGTLALIAMPMFFEVRRVFVDVAPALFMLVFVLFRLAYRRWRSGELVNSFSGLPNLSALRRDPVARRSALVAVRVQNFAEIASTLSNDAEGELSRQIAGRLSAGGTASLFQGDEGIFAWYTDSAPAIVNHLEALHALFRSPLTLEKRSFDVALTFGVELGSDRSIASRLGSALAAAGEAWDEGLRWKYHDPARQEEIGWRLSLLGQLDAAIDNGEVWIAYQPQFDLTRRIVVGAEALARWTHPEKGPISPVEFIAAAEQQGRIGKLTDFVLDRAISTAAAINRRGVDFSVAVNVSARLLSDRQLIDRVQRMLKAHGLRPDRLTLELTETEALHGAAGGIATLDALRSSGVRIAIDDYGTGLSTLEYLKKVPANEIKIDQSFVKAMRFNRSDLIMVQSTIALAHSLGRTVVAEGVEDRQCLDELAAMGCDVAQGFVIGRPMGVRELVQRLQLKQPRRVA